MGTFVQATSIFGVKGLDDEHQATTGGIQKLSSSLNEPTFRPEATEAALGELIDILKIHFLNEEAWMQENEYPGFYAHKRQHEKLISVLVDFQGEFKADPKRSHGQKIHLLLEDWLSHHTLHSDRVVAKYLLQRRSA